MCWLINVTQYKCRKFQSSKLKMPVAGVDFVDSAIQVEQLKSILKGLSLACRPPQNAIVGLILRISSSELVPYIGKFSY